MFVFDFVELLEGRDVVVFDGEMLEGVELVDVGEGGELAVVEGEGEDGVVEGGDGGERGEGCVREGD